MRISKKILACVLAALMAFAMMPMSALADEIIGGGQDIQGGIPGTPGNPIPAIPTNVAAIGDTEYATLDEAIAACPDNAASATTIKLLAAVTTTSTTVINNGKNIKINLNSKSITSANVDPMFRIEGGKLETSGTGTIESTTNDCTVFRVVGKKDADAQYSKLLIGGSNTGKGNCTTVISKEYGVLIPSTNNYADGVYVEVKGIIQSGVSAIYTNGNINKYGENPAQIFLRNASSPKLICTDDKNNAVHDNAAVYAAGYAVWTFSTGSVTGPTALYAKCGKFTLSGTSFNGTGSAVAYSHNGNGISATGEAVVFENCAGYLNELDVAITKGTFNSVNANPVGSYAWSKGTDTRESITGFVDTTSTGVGPAFQKNGVAADASEFYSASLAEKFANGNAYVESNIFSLDVDGRINATTPGAKIVRDGKDYYCGNVIKAANNSVAGDTVVALTDFSTGSQVVISNPDVDVTIDLGGHTYNSTSSYYPIRVEDGSSATFTNGTITNPNGISMVGNSKLVIADDCTVNGNISNYDTSDTTSSTAKVDIYGTVNGTVAPSTPGTKVNIYDGAEITAATAINANSGTVVNVKGGTVTGTVKETGTGEVNITAGAFDTDVTEFVVEGSAQDSVTGVVLPAAVDTMSITVEDDIDLNIYLDDSNASESYNRINRIEYTYNATPDLEQETMETVTVPATRDANDKVVLKIDLAPGQIRDEIRVRAFTEANEEVRDFTTSIAQYCDDIINGNYPTDVKDLAKSTLDYGKGASRYFGYNTEAYSGYSLQLGDPTSQINTIAAAAANNTIDTNKFTITGVSYRATSKPEIRFYIDPDTISEDELAGYNRTVVSTIGTAYFAKHDDDYLLIVKDIDIVDFGKQFVVTVKDSHDPLYDWDVVHFTPITWVKAALASSDENLAFLAKTIGNYYLKSVNYFGA